MIPLITTADPGDHAAILVIMMGRSTHERALFADIEVKPTTHHFVTTRLRDASQRLPCPNPRRFRRLQRRTS